MKAEKDDSKFIKTIIRLKYASGYECRFCCGTDYFERKSPPTFICKKIHCHYEESITAYTAFHRLRMPIWKAMGILIAIQKNYINWENSWQERNYNYSRYDTYEIERERKNSKRYTPRLSLEKIAKLFDLEKKTVGAYLKRIGNWIPEEYSNNFAVDSDFYEDLKAESKKTFIRISNLLFDGDVKRSKKQILCILVKPIIKENINKK